MPGSSRSGSSNVSALNAGGPGFQSFLQPNVFSFPDRHISDFILEVVEDANLIRRIGNAGGGGRRGRPDRGFRRASAGREGSAESNGEYLAAVI